MDPKEKLAKALSRPDTILFIGSGVSCSAGLPDWKGLLVLFSTYCENLGKDVAEANDLIENNNLDEAASCLQAQIDQAEFEGFFQTEESFQQAEPTALHQRIMAFGLSCFVTTNYDTLIEDSFCQENPGANLKVVINDNTNMLARIQTNSVQNYIYKYHGDINHADSIVLTSLHYAKIIHERTIVRATLETLMKSRAVVMIGVGLNDPDLDIILTGLAITYRGNIEDIYSINPNVGEVRKGVIKKTKGIDIISYSADSGDHSLLEALLDELYKQLSDDQEIVKPRTDRDSDDRPPQPEYTTEAIAARLDQLSPDDAELRRIILSASFWTDPTTTDDLLHIIRRIKADVHEESFGNNLNWLIQQGILRESSDLVFPVDIGLVNAVAQDRLGDAEILLTGADDE